MKAVVLGDVHFGVGASLGKTDKSKRLNTRLLDFSKTFDYVIDYMISNDIKIFIITGDIFEHRRPRASELGIFAEKIQRLEEHGIQTHIVAGNHDIIADERSTTVDVLQKLKLPKTFIHSDISSVSYKDNSSGMNFVFLPFRTKSILNCSTNKEALDRVQDRIKYEMDTFDDSNKFLVGHFMFKETLLGSLSYERNGDEVIFPMEMFGDFDGVMVGHIHPHQILQREPLITYVGSMECKDFGESEHEKYFLVIDNSNNNLVYNFEKLPIRKLYDIKLDMSNFIETDQFIAELKKGLEEFSKTHNMIGSIVKLSVFVSNSILDCFDRDNIFSFLKNKLKVSYCEGIHPFVNSKRQLRKASITEGKHPKESFVEYVNDILVNESEATRIKMIECGLEIIRKGGDK